MKWFQYGSDKFRLDFSLSGTTIDYAKVDYDSKSFEPLISVDIYVFPKRIMIMCC